MTVRDVAIIGSGLVGATAALALSRGGLDVALVGADLSAAGERPPESWDPRIYAISPGSRSLLERVEVWSSLPVDRIQPVRSMRIQGDAGGVLGFEAMDSGVEALAYILESRLLSEALHRKVRSSGIELKIPARPVAMEQTADHMRVDLDNGAAITARLVVGADGARSWVRRWSGIPCDVRIYPQTAVVANFESELSHGGVARQWFREDGILALLPLPGRRVSMVWSAAEGKAKELLDLHPQALSAVVSQAFQGVAGELTSITPAASFPLRRLNCARYIAPRLVLIGDAAHNIHPLAGQGLNLGLRDVQSLADLLTNRGADRDCGSLSLLRRYQRTRREDVSGMIAVTDGLQRLFSSRSPGVPTLRNLGLSLTGRVPMIRRALAQHALA
ncbi:MAG: UbiH/UbiF family hydroxylase [Betaproteobacteria bacterium]|nr:UbiH/UbiF family hydroxylase [Betaproteobacteria bacterium]